MSCGVGRRCGSHSTPCLGTSICHTCGPKKQKRKKEKKKKPYDFISLEQFKVHRKIEQKAEISHVPCPRQIHPAPSRMAPLFPLREHPLAHRNHLRSMVLDATHHIGLDKDIMACPLLQRQSIYIRASYRAISLPWKILCARPIHAFPHSHPSHGNPSLFTVFICFAFSRISYNWKCAVFSDWLLITL